MISTYQSALMHKTSTPVWRETLRFHIPFGMIGSFVDVLTFRQNYCRRLTYFSKWIITTHKVKTRDSAQTDAFVGRDKSLFTYIPVCSADGSVLPDGEHHLTCYRSPTPPPASLALDQIYYLNEQGESINKASLMMSCSHFGVHIEEIRRTDYICPLDIQYSQSRW